METNLTFKRTRIAPTPSGYLHLGNVLSFAITVALARKTDAKVLLRIDDLDRHRVKPPYVQDIFDTLDYLELPWDEGPTDYQSYEREYAQIHRMDSYMDALRQLSEEGHVFACDCSRAQVMAERSDGAYPGTCRSKRLPLDQGGVNWRLSTATFCQLTIHTPDGGMIQSALPVSMRDFIIRKKDGLPAYQLASVMDDLYFGVDLVVRGEDLWDSTLAQLCLSAALENKGFSKNAFYHHALLKSDTGDKLSKSAGATSVQYLRKQGKTRSEIYGLIGGMLGIAEPITTWQDLSAY